VTAIYAAAAAVPVDCVARRKILLEAMLAQGQLGYAAVYVEQLSYGAEEPFIELPLSTLPEEMQSHYRAALQRAAAGGASSGAAVSDADAGYTGNDPNTDSSDDDDVVREYIYIFSDYVR
jgi:hypothetical protein